MDFQNCSIISMITVILVVLFGLNVLTLYTVDATEFVTAQTDATFHEGRGKWKAVSWQSCQFYRH